VRYSNGILGLWLMSCQTGAPRHAAERVSNAEHWAASPGTAGRLRAHILPLFSDENEGDRTARYAPVDRLFDKYFGTYGRSVRGMTGGVRTEWDASGALRSAAQPFRNPPTFTLPLSARFGGGALFLSGTTVYRSETWLGDLVPLLTVLPGTVSFIEGLDRVYLVANGRRPQAFDPTTGALLGEGAWPSSSNVSQFIAFEETRAVALVDGTGLLRTQNAGLSWEPISLPFAPAQLTAMGSTIVAIGPGPNDRATAYEISAQGTATPREDSTPIAQRERDGSYPPPAAERIAIANPEPMVMAIEDGFPLADGSVLVARAGVLFRINLHTATIVESAAFAFPDQSAVCHPLVVGDANSRALVFACGSRFGETTLYRYCDGGLKVLAAFSDPRVVLGGATGAIAVRGGCGRASLSIAHTCLVSPNGSLHEIRIDGALRDARLVPLTSDLLAVLTPPHGSMQSAHVTFLSNTRTTTHPLVFPKMRAEMQRALEEGLWLDGFEERSPGVIGGWVEYQGLVIGVEFDGDGRVKVGEWLSDACSSTVAGRYGFRFCGGQHGFETTNGGMTWKQVATPEALVRIPPSNASNSRIAGPIGALTGGWARIGWGVDKTSQAAARHTTPPPATLSSVRLDCTRTSLTLRSNPTGEFYGALKPKIAAADLRVSLPVAELADRFSRTNPAAQIDAWGAKGDGWDAAAMGIVRWLPVFPSAPTALSTRIGLLPKALRALIRPGAAASSASRFGQSTPTFAISFGADARRALLSARADAGSKIETRIFTLTAGRASSEVTRSDGEPFGDLEAAIYAAGQWYISTFSDSESTLLAIEGTLARKLATLPRVSGAVGGRSATGLAHTTDGSQVAWLLEGPSADRSSQDRWLYRIDRRTGERAQPINLGSLSGAEALKPCAAHAAHADEYIFETAISNPIILDGPKARIGTMYNTRTKIRASKSESCILAIAGSLTQGGEPVHGATSQLEVDNTIPVTLAIDEGKQLLRCKP
jgi:hypothetical protein